MKFDRAWRIAQNARLKKKRSKYWSFSSVEGFTKTPTQIGFLLNTPKNCSCWMCGNPRKYENESTIQERRSTQKERGYHDSNVDILKGAFNHEQNLSTQKQCKSL